MTEPTSASSRPTLADGRGAADASEAGDAAPTANGRGAADANPADGARANPSGGITFRPLRATDADALCDLILAARAVDGPSDPVSCEEIRHLWFNHPGLDHERDSLAAVAPDGTLAGAVAAFARDQPTAIARVFIPGAVHPAYRRRGIGTRLLSSAQARARELLVMVPADLTRQIDCESPAGALDRIALFEAEGFQRARSFLTMHVVTADPLPCPDLPSGLVSTTWEPALDDATRLAHNDAFRDHWGSDPLSPERWHHFVAGVPGFRADASWLAVDPDAPADARVAGYALAALSPDGAGGGVGWLGTIGVRRAWRHQGVASALIARSLASLAEAGAARVGLDVDADNPTGAVRVYAALGFRSSDESIIFSKLIED